MDIVIQCHICGEKVPDGLTESEKYNYSKEHMQSHQ